jgi:hypothetical protein
MSGRRGQDVVEDTSMSDGEASGSVRVLLEQLAEAVAARTTSPRWHVEEVPASAAHGRETMLIFTSPLDPTVEEVVVTVEVREGHGVWGVDVIDREGLPLVEPVEWHSGDGHDESLDVLSQTVAELEDRIIGTLEDLRKRF